MKLLKLCATFSVMLIILTGCKVNDTTQTSAPATETQTEIAETVSPANTAKQLSKDKLFSMNIPISEDWRVWYEWWIIGSMEAVDDLSLHLDLPLDELYEWCSKIDFKREIVFLDYCSSDCVPDNAYVYNGMVHFECSHDMNYGGAIIAAAIPREDINVLMYETRFDLFGLDGTYVFGSPEAMEYCTVKFADPYWNSSEIKKYDVNGKRLAEWGKGVDFEKYAIALQVKYFGSSSYEETLKDGVYLDGKNFIFDYEVTCPSLITHDTQTVFCAGIVPKEQLKFLEIDDPFGTRIVVEEALPHSVKILFRQCGGENIGDLFIDSSYTLEKFESGNGWVQIECPTNSNEEDKTVLAEFGRTEYCQKFSGENMLTPGKYRIGKTVINQQNDDFEEMVYYADFSITKENYEYYSSMK